MDILKWILHIDVLLPQLLAQYPNGFLGIITGIVFLETGVVFLPFLPGDSLLFAAGALISQVHLSFWLFWVFLISAAILGDTLNYKIGQYFGQWLL
jgi:membrane-associated protein